MKVSHVLYKVDDLDKAVQQYKSEGFEIEYGRNKNPYNAVVYFSEGPYLELFNNSNMPKVVKVLLRIFGKSKMVNRMNTWENAKEGLIAVCLENHKENLSEEKKLFKKHKYGFFSLKNSRLDTKNRLLKYHVLFPDDMKIPFLMTRFSIDPRPKNLTHPNGITSIKSISFGTDEKLIPFINELCNDPVLKLFVGDGVKDLKYNY